MHYQNCLRVALISTDYQPLSTSAAVQMRDLAREFVRQGHDPIVIVPSEDIAVPWVIEILDGVRVLRLAGPRTRHENYMRRSIAELVLPFIMIFRLCQSPFRNMPLDLVVWYSPSIFFGPLIWFMKRMSACRTYLILRDIFPEWALDLGLIKKGPVFWFFKGVANFQYMMADKIGVQSPSNLVYLASWFKSATRRVEVLQNWQTPAKNIGTSILLDNTTLAGRKIFIYIGNMGVAQGMDILIDLADRLKDRIDIGFLFVGRGSEVNRLRARIIDLSLSNTLFFNEVDSREMPGLLAQCHIGLVALDPRHLTHNIPGKFLTYLLAGLPVLARINADTDLMKLIEESKVGRVFVGESIEIFSTIAKEMVDTPTVNKAMGLRGSLLAKGMFSSETAVRQIVASVNADSE
jgi:glycosyltransferase involved in cell wall biosynthesis